MFSRSAEHNTRLNGPRKWRRVADVGLESREGYERSDALSARTRLDSLSGKLLAYVFIKGS